MQVLEIAVENKKDSFAQEPAEEERLASIVCVCVCQQGKGQVF